MRFQTWWSKATLVILALYAAGASTCGGGEGDDDEGDEAFREVTVRISLNFPSSEIHDATKNIVLLVRPTNGATCAADLRSMTFSETAVGTVLEYPGTNRIIRAPKLDGQYDVFMYTYAAELERFCSSDVDCQGASAGAECVPIGFDRKSCSRVEATLTPTAAGCTRTTLTSASDNAFAVALEKF